MTKPTCFAALLSLSLLAFLPIAPRAAHAAHSGVRQPLAESPAEIFGFNHVETAQDVVFASRGSGVRCWTSRHHRHCLAKARGEAVILSREGSAHAGASAIDARESGRPLELHPMLAVARRYLGAGKITRYAGPWCRDFINVVARQAGVRLANTSRRAIDALGLGRHVSDPRPGDLVVMSHHVTIFAGWGGRGVLGLGGNQGHRVKVSNYPLGRVLAFVRV